MRICIRLFVALMLVSTTSACGGGGGGPQQAAPPIQSVDANLDWGVDNWDEKNWQ